jgi:transposase
MMSTPVLPVEFSQLTAFAGFDWATEKHDVVVLDPQGNRLLEMRFAHTAEGWNQLRTKLGSLGKVGVAIETNCGPAVERLLDMGVAVYPLNPKAAERYRDRQAPSGVKDDAFDAWCFAEALRTEGQHWRILEPLDPKTQLLRILCRDEISMIEQRTALVLQLQAALGEYYPAALEAFDDWTTPSTWQFLLRFPTPQELVQAGKRNWLKFLHTHKLYRPETTEKRLEIFMRADIFMSPSATVTEAKSMLAVALARQLDTLERLIQEYRRRIEELFDQHPSSGLFKSLPAAGVRLAPRLLAEIGANPKTFASPQGLQCLAGTAPITRQSGKFRSVKMRRGCNMTLRSTVHLWASASREKCAWAQAYYAQKRVEGKNHAQALRCLGQRWLKIIWRMVQTNTPYDEAKHMQSMLKHGSWVLAMMAPAPATKATATAT